MSQVGEIIGTRHIGTAWTIKGYSYLWAQLKKMIVYLPGIILGGFGMCWGYVGEMFGEVVGTCLGG